MNDKYIYVIGKPNTKSDLIGVVHALGYKLGLLLDKNVSDQDTLHFDKVIKIDFSDLDNEITRLNQINLNAIGLLCTYENYLLAKSRIGQALNLPVLDTQSTKLCTDKYLMRQAFINNSPDITPNFALIDSLKQAQDFANTFGYPLIIKPTGLVKSLLVSKCNNSSELTANYNHAIANIDLLYKKYNIFNRKPQLIIEEFIKGKQYSIAALVDHNGAPHFCEGIVEITTAQDIGIDDTYLYKRSFPSQLEKDIKDQLFAVAKQGVISLGMKSTPAHIELIYGEKGAKIIEIGARTGGYRPRMYDYSYGIDLTRQEVQIALGQLPELSGYQKSACAVYEIFPEKTGDFTRLVNDVNPSSVKYHRIVAKPGTTVGPAKDGFKAVAIIIVVEKDEKLFLQKCSEIEQIKAETKQ